MSHLNISRDVARGMARTAWVVRDAVKGARSEGAESRVVERLHQAYRKEVDAGATAAKFADTLAQVAVYALFVARCLHAGAAPFSRASVRVLPAPHPFLGTLFDVLSGSDRANDTCTAALDELVDALSLSDVSLWMGEREHGELIGSFYEAFLREYDPVLRSKRGVYLTPEPVVGYLVRAVDALLDHEFGLANGLATRDPDVRLIVEDPACGTGAFLAAVLAQVQADRRPHGSPSDTTSEPCDSPVIALRGCELLSAPYLLAHLLAGLQHSSCPSIPSKSVCVALGNALESLDTGFDQMSPRRSRPSASDAGPQDAGALFSKTQSGDDMRDILVMLGNPPYSGHSANSGRGITNLLHGRAPDGSATDSYFAVDGAPLAERNSKWLLDDYVKFMRYAQWRIERAGQGIFAFVTNSGYLEGPIYRGMRRSLMRTFDALYVLDLHGDSRRRERSPALPDEGRAEGTAGRDENVFAIQQGVALALFVRRRESTRGDAREGRVWRADLRGSRAAKLRWLAAHSVADTPWREVQPGPPLYSFAARSHRADVESESWPLSAVMPERSLGVLTKRDRLVVGFAADALLAQITDFADLSRSDAECASMFGLPLRDRDRWDLARVRTRLASGIHPAVVQPYKYRPLDTRYIYYDPRLIARPNRRVMRHLDAHPENIALVVGRQGAATGAATWDVAFVTAGLVDQNLFRRGGACVFPLYLYPDPDDLSEADSARTRRPNLAPEFVKQFAATLGLPWVPDGKGDLSSTFGPDDVLAYIYALLFAPSFRARHADTLRADFPRIPLPRDAESFRALCSLGARLVALHLGQRSPAVLPRFVGAGNNRVERVLYLPGRADGEAGSIAINATQRFEGVSRDVWEGAIGGYRVARKWLLDRRGRRLSAHDVTQYRQVVGVLDETRELMRCIDEALAPRW